MGNLGFWKEFKLFIGSVGFRLFLWGNNTTQEKYWQEIYEQENTHRQKIANLEQPNVSF